MFALVIFTKIVLDFGLCGGILLGIGAGFALSFNTQSQSLL